MSVIGWPISIVQVEGIGGEKEIVGSEGLSFGKKFSQVMSAVKQAAHRINVMITNRFQAQFLLLIKAKMAASVGGKKLTKQTRPYLRK
jgi:hypothetical protein